MQVTELNYQTLARTVGLALLASIIFGIMGALFIAHGIDINLSADVIETAQNMLGAEQNLRAKAYLAIVTLGLEALVGVGLYLLLKRSGPLLAGWSLFMSLAGAVLMFFGAVFALNVAEFVGDAAYRSLTNDSQKLMLAGLQATSDYTSFHLGLITGTVAKAGFFYLFLRSALIPKLIAAWGVFASLFVAFTIVARDFIPALGHNAITAAFMLSNMLAIVALALYLIIQGVRE